ncbi:MAG: hypothetical protein AAF202_01715 [Pseudomonadota bacterium]
MKSARLTLIFLVVGAFFANPSFAGSGTGLITVTKILTWTNGDYKVYFSEGDRVNGREGCTATDSSLAVVSSPETLLGEKEIFDQLMYAKQHNKRVRAFVEGCCKNHNGKQSPCIKTVSGEANEWYALSEAHDIAEAARLQAEAEARAEAERQAEIERQLAARIAFVPAANTSYAPSAACGELIPVGCISGENRLANVGAIGYPFGIWGGVKASPGNTVVRLMIYESGRATKRLTYCYSPGQRQDNDRTDLLVGYVCKGAGTPLIYSLRSKTIGERRTGDDR